MKRKIYNIIIYIILILGLLLVIGSGCTPKVCPTYDSNIRAKKQLSFERRGGHTSMCSYAPDITKKEKKRSNKIWNSNFCKVKQKKRIF